MRKDDERDSQTYAIIGAAMEVHRQLGNGFLEPVYQESLSIEFDLQSIPNEREKPLVVQYKGKQLRTSYRADFICFDDVIVELKAISHLTSVDEAQVINYMKATGLSRALLVNFGAPRLEYKRMVLGYKNKFSIDDTDDHR